MPKNINIQEGGDPKYMNEVKYIMTNLQGSGTCLWVPVDDVKLGTKTITKNGSYSASKSGLYGFEKVIVNVPGGDSNKTNNGKLADEDGNEAKDENGNSVTPAPSGGSGSSVSGTDPDDGNDYKVDVDENGNLKKTKLPSRIEVTRNPDKVDYTSGETLNPSGIIVHAYYGDGTDYGTVLNSELGYDPMTLEADESGSTHFDGLNTVSINGYNKQGRYFGRDCYYNDTLNFVGRSDSSTKRYFGYDGAWSGTISFTVYNGYLYAYGHDDCSGLKDQALMVFDEYGNGNLSLYGYLAGSPVVGGGWRSIGWGTGEYGNVPTSNIDPQGIEPSGGTQAIEVRWNRPADGKVLKATFDVTVMPAGGGGSGGGASHGF